MAPGSGWRPLPPPPGVGGWVLAASAAGFLLMVWDKWQARRGGRRVPERVLWLVALLGGTPGLLLGMQLCRHKTRQWAFAWGLPLLLAAQAWFLARLWRR